MVLAADVDATVEVQIVLEAVPCLVLIWEPWIIGNGLRAMGVRLFAVVLHLDESRDADHGVF